MLLSIDYGTKRIGLATGDKETRLALPYKTLPNNKNFFDFLKEICKSENIEEIVVGLPMPLRVKACPRLRLGEGEQIKRVRDFIENLKKEIQLPVKTIDERFTTREVESHFTKLKKEMKKIDKDAVAAAIILQSYIDKKS